MTRAKAIIGSSLLLLLAQLCLHDVPARAQSAAKDIVVLVDGRVNCIGSDDYVWADGRNDIFRWNAIAQRVEQLKLPAPKYPVESRTIEGCIRSGTSANVLYRETGTVPDRRNDYGPLRVNTSIWLTEHGHRVVSEREGPYPFTEFVMEYPLLEADIIVASDLSVYRFDAATWTGLPIRLAEFLAVGVLPMAPSPRPVVCFDVDYEAVRNPRPSVQCSVLQVDGSGIGILPITVVGDGLASARQLPYVGDFRYFSDTVAASCAVRASTSSTVAEPSIKLDCRPVNQNFTPLAEYAVADGFVVLSVTNNGVLCRLEYRSLQAELVQERCYQLTDAQDRPAPFPRLTDPSRLRAFEIGSGTDWKFSIFGAAVDPKFSFGLKPR